MLPLRVVDVQASTTIDVMRGRGRLQPFEHLRQLPLQHVEFGDLPLHGAQLLRHELLQAGAHGQTLPAIKLSRQRFQIGQGEP